MIGGREAMFRHISSIPPAAKGAGTGHGRRGAGDAGAGTTCVRTRGAGTLRYDTHLLPLWQRPPHYTVPAHCRTSTVASQPASTQ
jgi:hypothetical protein